MRNYRLLTWKHLKAGVILLPLFNKGLKENSDKILMEYGKKSIKERSIDLIILTRRS